VRLASLALHLADLSRRASLPALAVTRPQRDVAVVALICLLGLATACAFELNQHLVEWASAAPAHERLELDELPVALALGGIGFGWLAWRRQRDWAAEASQHAATIARLVSARNAAEQASRTRSEFLANMSHELRTPLNAVIGFSEIIARQLYGPVGNATYRQYAEDINRSGDHLLAVINDILDIAKAEAGAMSVERELIDADAVVADAIRMVEKEAGERGIALSCRGTAGALESDARKLKQILLNLLSNAIKFTASGGQVGICAGRSGSDVVLSVEDTGIGMSEAEIEVALTPFGQVESGLARTHQGTGLGLPLARQLTELLRGRFDVASSPGKGTRVSLVLPAPVLAAQP